MDKGEDLHVAAVREILEETGIKTKFVSIAAIRESQSGPFDTTDCYCVCVMMLDEDEYGDEIPTPSPQEVRSSLTVCSLCLRNVLTLSSFSHALFFPTFLTAGS